MVTILRLSNLRFYPLLMRSLLLHNQSQVQHQTRILAILKGKFTLSYSETVSEPNRILIFCFRKDSNTGIQRKHTIRDNQLEKSSEFQRKQTRRKSQVERSSDAKPKTHQNPRQHESRRYDPTLFWRKPVKDENYMKGPRERKHSEAAKKSIRKWPS